MSNNNFFKMREILSDDKNNISRCKKRVSIFDGINNYYIYSRVPDKEKLDEALMPFKD